MVWIWNLIVAARTPYELWKCHMPNVKYLKVWGCLAKVMALEPKKRKLDSKTVNCMFIGYAENSTAYKFFVLKSGVLDRNTIMSLKTLILLSTFFRLRLSIKNVSLNNSRQSGPDLDGPIAVKLRSKRTRKETNFGGDYYVFLVDNDPLTYSEAICPLQMLIFGKRQLIMKLVLS